MYEEHQIFDKIKSGTHLTSIAYNLDKEKVFPFTKDNIPNNNDDRKKEIIKILMNCYGNIDYYDDKKYNSGIDDNQKDDWHETQCKSPSECKALLYIIDVLQRYQHNSKLLVINIDINNKYKDLVSDYHHLLTIHLNNVSKIQNEKNFNYIYTEVSNNVNCDCNSCDIFINHNNGNHKKRNKSTNNDHHLVITELIDTMHVYLLHSFDLGFRTKKYINNDTKDENENFEVNFADDELKRMQETVWKKRKKSFNRSKFTSKPNEPIQQFQNKTQFIEVLNEHLVANNLNEQQMIQWKTFLDQNAYDTDSIHWDCTNIEDSNIYYFIKTLNIASALTCFRTIKSFKIPIHVANYNFGQRFYYWSYFKNHNSCNDMYMGDMVGKWYIKPKYLDLKKEILAKNVSIEHFKNTNLKANTLLNGSNTLRSIKSTYHYHIRKRHYGDNYYYELPLYSPLEIEHIMVLLFYSNFSKLSKSFSESFRKLHKAESDRLLKTRNSLWCHMSKKLRELVECYGDKIEDSSIHGEHIFYHGVSYLYFNKFVTRLNSPTSTTKQLEVAVRFCDTNGIILEMERYPGYPNDLLRYFNCTLVSAYSEEDERLFFGGEHEIQFRSIRIIRQKSHIDLYLFIKALTTFNKVITGDKIRNIYLKKKLIKMDVEIINRLLNPSLNDHKKPFPLYVRKCFKSFCQEKEAITFDIRRMNQSYSSYSKKLHFFQNVGTQNFGTGNFIQFSSVANIFENAEIITCKDTDYIGKPHYYSSSIISSDYISELLKEMKKINPRKKIKLKTICIRCTDQIDSKLDLCIQSFFRLNWKISIYDTVTLELNRV